MKRLIIILVTGIFCCNIVIAKELKTRFGFNIDLPDNYAPVQDANSDDLMNNYEGEEINIDLIKNLRTQTQNTNLDLEYYFPVDLDPTLNNLNLVIQKDENIVKRKQFLLETYTTGLTYLKDNIESLLTQHDTLTIRSIPKSNHCL